MSPAPPNRPSSPLPDAMHRLIDPELQTLLALLDRMFALVDEQFANAVDALTRRDAALAERVYHRDDEVDALELAMDREAERVLALHQPVASDLRFVITAIKVNADLERVGDHSKNLAKYVPFIASADVLRSTTLAEMADEARAMLREAQDAFAGRDKRLAHHLLARDRRIDSLYKENVAALLAYGREHPEALESVAYLLTASKSIERIADHAKNIGQSVVFMVEGVDIRHS